MVSTYFSRWTPMHSNGGPRRRHDAQLKAKVLAACEEPGASVAAVARAHDLNANLVHKWRRGRGVVGAAMLPPTCTARATTGEFLALSLAGSVAPAADIRIELKRGATAVVVSLSAIGVIRPLRSRRNPASWVGCRRRRSRHISATRESA